MFATVIYDIPPARGGNGKSRRNRQTDDFSMRPRTLLFVLIFAWIGCGCSRSAGAGSEKDPVHVLASVYALADIAREIGGDRVEVQWFVEDGQSLTELAETPERR